MISDPRQMGKTNRQAILDQAREMVAGKPKLAAEWDRAWKAFHNGSFKAFAEERTKEGWTLTRYEWQAYNSNCRLAFLAALTQGKTTEEAAADAAKIIP